MSRGTRILLCVFFSVIVLLGAGLFLVSRLNPVVQSYDTENSVCTFEYAIQLNPLQTKTNNCAVLQSDWLQLSVKSNLNITFSISLAKVGGGQVTLFNNTSTNLNATFPIPENGAIVTLLRNGSDNVSEVNGSLSVKTAVVANTTSLVTNHPYRTIGEGLLGLGALGILLVIWNPGLSGTVISPVLRREGPNSN